MYYHISISRALPNFQNLYKLLPWKKNKTKIWQHYKKNLPEKESNNTQNKRIDIIWWFEVFN